MNTKPPTSSISYNVIMDLPTLRSQILGVERLKERYLKECLDSYYYSLCDTLHELRKTVRSMESSEEKK